MTDYKTCFICENRSKMTKFHHSKFGCSDFFNFSEELDKLDVEIDILSNGMGETQHNSLIEKINDRDIYARLLHYSHPPYPLQSPMSNLIKKIEIRKKD